MLMKKTATLQQQRSSLERSEDRALAFVRVLIRQDDLDVLGDLRVCSGNALELTLDDLI
jgi:hypothetical protein